MTKAMIAAAAAVMLTAAAPAPVPGAAKVSITRLDCGTIGIKDFNAFFSDSFDYKPGPREITDSCYLVRHMNHYLLWDTGFDAGLKGRKMDMGPLVVGMTTTIPEQLAQLGLKSADITAVGISHMHLDHTGQAKDFPAAKLVIGKRDLELSKGKYDPFGPWRAADAKVEAMDGADVDIFGDGSVVAMNLPGHTPGHMALLVRLASGPVLLSGDLYHSDEARARRESRRSTPVAPIPSPRSIASNGSPRTSAPR